MNKNFLSSHKKNTHQNSPTLHDKTILVVHTGTIKKKFIFQKLKKLGLTVVVLHKEKDWAAPFVDHWILSDLNNYKESVEAVKTFMKTNPQVKIDGVLTFWEESVLLTSKIVDAFNFIGIPFSIAKKARNKFLFREFCDKNNIRAPKHMLIQNKNDFDIIENHLDFPLVIKPIYGSASAFVIKVEDREELIETYEYIKKNILSHPDASEWDELEVLVEEYIDGDEVDIDMLVQNGKIKFYSISDNDQTNEPFFVETGQSIPSHLPAQDQQALVEIAAETLEKLGVFHGCIHFEAKSTSSGPVPIEVNLRMGGDEVYSFVKGAWGVDLVEEAVKIALGIYIEVKKPTVPKKYITGKYFLSDHSGILVRQDISDHIKRKKYLDELHFYKKIGEPVLVPPEGYEYLGWITVNGNNLLDAQDNLNDAFKHIKYDVVKFDSESSMGKTLRKSRFSSAVVNKDLLLRAAKLERLRRISRQNLRSLHIGIACNIDENGNGDSETVPIEKMIETALIDRGYKVSIFNFNNTQKVYSDLRKSDVNLIFNICDKMNDSYLLEPHAASLLEILQIPYTGSSPQTLATCIDKISVKKLLTYHEIPTPRWDYAYTLDDEVDDTLRYPLIVKPSNTDDSLGITNDSVVTNKKQLETQLERVIVQLGSPALIEEYISGDEYDVSIVGSYEENDLRVLPLTRSIFKDLPEKYWHIYSYEAKQNTSKISDFIQIQRPPKNISKRLESLITEIALDTYNFLDCRDYGRVEIKVDENNNPYVLELNPNPSLAIDDFVFQSAKLMGMSFIDLIEEIIRMTIIRYKHKLPDYHNPLINKMLV